MYKISVIVPIYGVEQFIERCARSLFEQSLDRIEYIFVDDCSPDNAISILLAVAEDYPERKEAIRIIHHSENKGLPISRQSGISVATGEYIAHCDSDDWVEKDLFEKVYKKAILEELDVVIYDCLIVDSKNTTSLRSDKSSTEYSDCINKLLHRKMWWSLCNKAFKRNVYSNHLYFPYNAMGEDMCLSIQLMSYCRRIGYANGYYYYYKNNGSIVQSNSTEEVLNKYAQIMSNVELIRRFFADNHIFSEYEKGLNYIEYNAKFVLLPIIGTDQGKQMWREGLHKVARMVIYDRSAQFKERIRALCIILHLYPFNRL